MNIPRQFSVSASVSSPRRLAVLVAVVSAALAAACTGTKPPVEANPVITWTLDSAVTAGDSIHGEVIATDDNDLVSLTVTAYDTAGTDSIPEIVSNGGVVGASRFDAKFGYKELHVPAGGFVVFAAKAINEFGDSTIVRDSTHVTP